ncbi:multidrug efflux MFS transporter [Paenibacillus hemerocallicola]|uniref:Multidrug efflux MFS transporter n=1 Tax=Paenibacillus hemerocallicola TaxID=1172614 RepID=A0A5C4T6A7_9BACL|nr:DHA2 family efflux MFS transporter permease subunit [Paenibacillus hemerocallicola]TNJ64562.1 multidrug efflux MFS transporter [Paenibacillus hemerocallicola]
MNTGIAGKEASSAALSGIKRGPIVAALIIGAFVSILNETLLNIAYPEMMKQFDVTASTIQWLSTGYMLIIGILVPVTALLQQWFTTRQMFLSAMTIFLAGTIVCAAAPWFGMLLFGRIVQALGTGLMLPVLMTTILVIFPPEKRGGAMGLIGLVIMFAPAIGPTLSGMIVDSLSWRWLFYLVIPLAVFSIVFAASYLKNVSELTRPKVDMVSILLSSIGFGGIVYGFSQAGEGSWSEPEVFGAIIAGGVSITLFIWRQLVVKEPILELRVFKYPLFSLAMVLILLLMMMIFAVMIILPLYFQTVLLMTAFNSGLALMPGGILNGIMAPISGKLFDNFGPRALVIPGLVLAVLSIGLFIGVGTGADAWYVIILHVILLGGFSMVMMPAQTTGLNQLPRHLYPHGTAIINTLQQVAGAIGTALFISIMSSGTKAYMNISEDPTSPVEAMNGFVAGMQDAFFAGLIISLIALATGFFIKQAKTSNVSTMDNTKHSDFKRMEESS